MPLFPFLGGLGSLINPFKQKRGTLFKPRLLGSLVVYIRVILGAPKLSQP